MNPCSNPQTLWPKISRDDNKSNIGKLDFIWMEITPKCNLSCIHCYADSGPDRKLHDGICLEDWLEALRQAAGLRCRKVQFTGGEPTLHPNLFELIQSARELGFTTVEVYTNGTLFTETLKNHFLRHHTSLAFSVYSTKADVHDAITQKKGSFYKTMTSIQWAVQSGLPVRVAIVQMETNADHIDHTRKMLQKMGVTSISSGRVRGIGRGSKGKRVESQFDELCGRCSQWKLCLTSSGEIFPCVFSRFYLIGDLNQGLRKVLESAKFHDFYEKLKSIQSKQHWNEQIRSCLCDPDLPNPPCDPDLPNPPCDPDLPNPPCDPDLPNPLCDPELPEHTHETETGRLYL